MAEADQDAPPAALGEVIDGYRLEAVLGDGGFGCVYRAVDVLLERAFAMKVLRPAFAHDAEWVSRFFHEAKIVNAIKHTNIVDIIRFVNQTEPRRVAYVMELLKGVPLDSVIKKSPLPLRQAVNASFQLANALEAVHAQSVVHRDLKPQNVFVIGDLSGDLGEVPSVKILDFGIAKISRPDVAHKTKTGLVMGSLAYMAPEQILGEPVSPATDVYALAEIFIETITGRAVFAGKASGIANAKLTAQVPELALPADLPGGERILTLVKKCLSATPEERPTLDAFRAELLRVLEAGDAKPIKVKAAIATDPAFASSLATGRDTFEDPEELGEKQKRKPWLAAVGAIALVAVVAGVGVEMWPDPEYPEPEAPPEQPAVVTKTPEQKPNEPPSEHTKATAPPAKRRPKPNAPEPEKPDKPETTPATPATPATTVPEQPNPTTTPEPEKPAPDTTPPIEGPPAPTPPAPSPSDAEKELEAEMNDASKTVADRKDDPTTTPPPKKHDDEVEILLGGRDKKPTLPREKLPDQLDEATILGVLRKHTGDITACVSKHRAAGGKGAGKMTVTLLVQPTGRPSSITIAPDRFKDSIAAKCLSASVPSWSFPKFTGKPMTIDFPVSLLTSSKS